MTKIKKIRLYSTMTCPYCKMEKAWLDEKKLEHEMIFVDLDPYQARRLVGKTGQLGVPVTEIEYDNGETRYVIGFDRTGLEAVLKT